MEVEVILLIEYPPPCVRVGKCKMLYIIGNKKYTNKRKCASLCKRTLYRLQSTAAKKENV